MRTKELLKPKEGTHDKRSHRRIRIRSYSSTNQMVTSSTFTRKKSTEKNSQQPVWHRWSNWAALAGLTGVGAYFQEEENNNILSDF